MKPDEKLLWESFGEGTTNVYPKDVPIKMPPKRMRYLCEKWAAKGIYEWGVIYDLGWKVKGENK